VGASIPKLCKGYLNGSKISLVHKVKRVGNNLNSDTDHSASLHGNRYQKHVKDGPRDCSTLGEPWMGL